MMISQFMGAGAAILLLAGCESVSLNPFDWFGSDTDVEMVDDVPVITVTDSRPLIATVTSLIVEETPGGAIVRAVGLPPEQGWYDADLVSETRGEPVDGILTFFFRARPPEEATRVSTVDSREIIAGRFVSELTLAETREIRVVAAGNTRAVRR